MNNLLKKNLLVEDEPRIIRREPNENHNEITVAIVKYGLPLKSITESITPLAIKKIKKIMAGYPAASIRFDFNQGAPTFLFTCKSKTERRGDDTPNQELADRIAIAKCRAKACTISKRIAEATADALVEEAHNARDAAYSFAARASKEASYIQKV